MIAYRLIRRRRDLKRYIRNIIMHKILFLFITFNNWTFTISIVLCVCAVISRIKQKQFSSDSFCLQSIFEKCSQVVCIVSENNETFPFLLGFVCKTGQLTWDVFWILSIFFNVMFISEIFRNEGIFKLNKFWPRSRSGGIRESLRVRFQVKLLF